MNFNPVLKGLSLICLSAVLFTGLSTCSHSESVKQYIADQINPFNKKHVAFAVYSKIEESQYKILFSLQTPRNELTFHQIESGFEASFSVRLNVKNHTDSVILDTVVFEKIRVQDFKSTRAFILEKTQIPLSNKNGDYKIDGLFIDENSKSEIVFSTTFSLDVKDYTIQLSSLRFLDNHLPEHISLTKKLSFGGNNYPGFAFEVDTHPSESNKRVLLAITKLLSDTLSARPIWGINPIEGGIETRGYKLHTRQFTVTLLDTILNKDASKTHTFFVPVPDTLQKGVYTGQVIVKSDDHEFNSKNEVFYIFPREFPYFKSISEGIQPLKYLATTSEIEDIYLGGDSLLKQNFDRFWLKLTNNNVEAAKKKIALFYQRAEEANFLFSTYKPGWKTDLGMLYILLGPPEMVEWRPTKLTWYYNYKRAGGKIPLEFNPIRVDNVIIGYSLDRYLDYIAYEDFWLEYRREWEKNN